MEFFKKCLNFLGFFNNPYNLSAKEREHVDAMNSRKYPKGIDVKELYDILGHTGDSFVFGYLIQKREYSPPRYANASGDFSYAWDSYIKGVKEKIKSRGYGEHILVSEHSEQIFVPEKGFYYNAKRRITIKNMTINVSTLGKSVYFYPPVDSYAGKSESVYFVFENNRFVKNAENAFIKFCTRDNTYFSFKNNKFKSVNMKLLISPVPNASTTPDKNAIVPGISKIEFKKNIFENGNLDISGDGNGKSVAVISMYDNIFYRTNEKYSQLNINFGCHFGGKNTVDNLTIAAENLLYWGGEQNIDPQGEYALIHKSLFIKTTKKAAERNDKMQEAKLRKEWLKCEKFLLGKEKNFDFIQDRIIIWWIWLISDYGTQWFRPILWLLGINAGLAFAASCFFATSFSWSGMLLIFVKFFNPLSDLYETIRPINIWHKVGISFIAVVQKVVFATVIYETLKIFRRCYVNQEVAATPLR